MPPLINLTGEIFDRLTVLERYCENGKNGKPRWSCKCECGNKCIVYGNHLREGNTKSCGCLIKENNKINPSRKLSYGEAAFNHLYNEYKNSAKKRGLEWNLSKEQFRILIDGNCIYCGIEPKQIHKNMYNNGDCIYNGIDRIDNDLGYTMKNCVSYCRRCNEWKKAMIQKDFINHINKIYKHFKGEYNV